MSAPFLPATVAVAGLCKAYGPTVALDDVGFSIEAGSVHALLGENGAGKSSLVKILSGLVRPDAGQILVAGRPVSLSGPRAAQGLGIQTAFQEMTLIRDLTVLDNMALPAAPTNALGMVRGRAVEDAVSAHFADLGLEGIDLSAEVGELELAERQKVEIARAVFRRPRILLLDEPSSTLSGSDVDWLGRVIDRQRAAGVTIVFISHRLVEVRAFCSGVTVLRGGRHVATGAVDALTDGELVGLIAGRNLVHSFPPRASVPHERGPEVLRGERLATAGKLRDASFSLHRGEILGVAGLQGMGQLDLFLAAFGMADLTGGRFRVDGKEVAIASPRDAIDARIGISLLPEDRKTEALFLKLDGTHNASLPTIGRFTRLGLVDAARERAAVERAFRLVEVDRRALWTPVGAFSGGNQQKVAIAKWLLAESRILMVYDPTRGIDVGTKNELYRLLQAYARMGGAVLFYSTEIPELVHLADRVMVFYGGRVAAELSGDGLTEESILAAALGGHAETARSA
ncbi:ribose transport system ATP-binding protein [Methylobacterium sp. 174MFSha1.1]|uniref:sugar ABC transporter ATP-binding protein n=1 Tax=Methylobacterium sp. 174MFSha1.1 TaxID=1502749 RepID=UPI0008E4B22E|nr:sugar ABC transporter ATP-binding protein [Methylobacterium sp. 174MFSha1.1]SFU75186.1 ribose transport system ATP-binding protein [Methylobacterium sp. 174MFSha1.1]